MKPDMPKTETAAVTAAAAPRPRPSKPVPSPSDANRPFWAGCAAGELRLKCCKACGRHQAPTRAACRCGGLAFDWVTVSGKATLFSYTVLHRAPDPAFKDDLPYVVAIVEFEQGGRLMSNLVGCAPEAVHCGMALEAVFETVAEGIGLPKFRPA